MYRKQNSSDLYEQVAAGYLQRGFQLHLELSIHLNLHIVVISKKWNSSKWISARFI